MKQIRNLAFVIMVASVAMLAKAVSAAPLDDYCAENVEAGVHFSWGPCSRTCTEMEDVQCVNFCAAESKPVDEEETWCTTYEGMTFGHCHCGPIPE